MRANSLNGVQTKAALALIQCVKVVASRNIIPLLKLQILDKLPKLFVSVTHTRASLSIRLDDNDTAARADNQ